MIGHRISSKEIDLALQVQWSLKNNYSRDSVTFLGREENPGGGITSFGNDSVQNPRSLRSVAADYLARLIFASPLRFWQAAMRRPSQVDLWPPWREPGVRVNCCWAFEMLQCWFVGMKLLKVVSKWCWVVLSNHRESNILVSVDSLRFASVICKRGITTEKGSGTGVMLVPCPAAESVGSLSRSPSSHNTGHFSPQDGSRVGCQNSDSHSFIFPFL